MTVKYPFSSPFPTRVGSRLALTLVLLLATLSAWSQSGPAANPHTQSFDQGWRFLRDDPKGAEKPDFADAAWRKLDLPHDWSIEDLPTQIPDSIMGPFSKGAANKIMTGYTVGGTGWYRKTFTLNAADKGKTAFLQFDGVYMNSDVWVNGQHVGNHPYGYTSFWYDITPYLKPAGQPNVVAVQVKNEYINARWYSGSGIYRHTWLTLANPVHIAPWGVYATTPTITSKAATVQVLTTARNTGKQAATVTYALQVYSPAGAVVGTLKTQAVIPAGGTKELKQVVMVANPALWSLEKTNLYRAEVALQVGGKPVDKLTTAVGIRTIHFDAKTGFTLNGKVVKLKGGCIHHDHGPLGAASIDRAEDRKIELLRKSGFNAIRCSHYPPSPGLLEACDRRGMLVVDEAFDMWERSKTKDAAKFFKLKGETRDYASFFKKNWQNDLQSMMLRDRNHPAIIMWSIGNEIGESADSSGLRIATNLTREVRKFDRTRPVTEALVDAGVLEGEGAWDRKAPHMALLDAVGYNYGFEKYEEDHKKYPNRIMWASEFEPPQSLVNWQKVEDLPYVIGNFSWVAMDYIGEAGTGVPRLVDANAPAASNKVMSILQFFKADSWPMVINFQGDLDLIGNRRTPYYYQHVVWRQLKAAMFVHTPIPAGKKEIISSWGFPDELQSWNWSGHEGEKLQVHVYTRCQQVKLELNGQPVGEQTVDDSKSITATFEVPYAPGILVAHCYDKGKEVATETIKTTGEPAAIKFTVDRSTIKADRNDLSYVNVEILDAQGNLVPNAKVPVSFQIAGNGQLAGVGTGSPIDVSSYQQPRKTTWQGKCLAIVRPTGPAGTITLTATAPGLKAATAAIVAK